MSLVELVVVLAILAMLAAVAVRSLDPLANQARYEVTQRILDELKKATVGDAQAKHTNGLPILSGFIADTGTLPTAMADFLSCPAGINSRATQTFDSDRDGTVDVTLTSGWNGPYFHLGAGESSIIDGWGNAPLVDPDGGTFDFRSLGSDNDSSAPESDYRANLAVEIASSEYLTDIVFRLYEISSGSRVDPSPTGNEQLAVLFYGINAAGGTDGDNEEVLCPVASSGTFEYRWSNAKIGRIAARAILWDDTDGDDAIDVGESIISKSYVHYLDVVAGSELRVEMELR